MSIWLAKEARDMIRLGRWIPLVAVYLFLGILQPITFKMLPVLLGSASNLPKGTVIQIPPPTVDQVLNGIIGQYNQLGMIALILVGMGLIAGERKTVGEWLWSKPVIMYQYILAKFTVFFLIAGFASLLGMSLGGYYTAQLIGPVDWTVLWQGALLYLLYQSFLISVILLASSLVTNPTLAGGVALLVIVPINMLGIIWHQNFVPGLLTLIQMRFSHTPLSGETPWEPVITTLLGTLFLLGLQFPLLAWRKTS
ncbi:MAG: ABC transporter permease [Desulfitobacteriaceae bacterium]